MSFIALVSNLFAQISRTIFFVTPRNVSNISKYLSTGSLKNAHPVKYILSCWTWQLRVLWSMHIYVQAKTSRPYWFSLSCQTYSAPLLFPCPIIPWFVEAPDPFHGVYSFCWWFWYQRKFTIWHPSPNQCTTKIFLVLNWLGRSKLPWFDFGVKITLISPCLDIFQPHY